MNILLLGWIISLVLSTPPVLKCETAEDKPIGNPRACALVQGEICCDWHYVTDRYCAFEKLHPDNDCTQMERAEDSMNALRAHENWCYRYPCGWFLNGEGYYNNWESEDSWSHANRRVRALLMKGKFKKAKSLARRTLKKLIRRGLCEKNEPCDDHLEFIIHASRRELERAIEEWVRDTDI